MLADVAQRRRAQQRIANRMQQHIGVGMAKQTHVMWNIYAADYQLAAQRKGVHVETLTDAQAVSHSLLCPLCRVSNHSASGKSSE
jgi:hypothetical protein